MSKSPPSIREGSLEAPKRHPLNWTDTEFYQLAPLQEELGRVFDICHGCRRCVSLCDAFPTLFDLIDESETFEVDGVDKNDYSKVVDECYLCDLCYQVKCPYVPPHEWNVDFPHLMLRAKAIQFKKGERKISHKLITSTDFAGKSASLPIINTAVKAATKSPVMRKLASRMLDIHPDAHLPDYHKDTLRKRRKNQQLALLRGIEDLIWIQVEGFDRIDAIANEDLERSNAEKTSAIHFMRFELEKAMIAALRAGAGLTMGSNHEHYKHRTEVDQVTTQALLGDLEA